MKKVLALLSMGLIASSASAADIAWGTATAVATEIGNSSDISTNGVLVEAFNAQASDATLTNVNVNGVTFTGTSALLSGGFTQGTADISSGTDGGDASYDALLSDADNGGGGGLITIQIGGGALSDGADYEVQVWFVDDRANFDTRTMLYGDSGTAPGGNTILLNDQFSIGIFTADGASQTLALDAQGFGNAHITAYQVRAISSFSPVILDFSANPSSVFSNGTATLSWNTVGETSLTLEPGIGDVTGLTSTQIVVTADTTYNLIAGNAIGSTTSSVQVVLITTPPVINAFTVDYPTVVNAGETVTLSWSVDDMTALSLDPGGIDVTGLTSTQIVVNADTEFMLTASNLNGSTNASADAVIGLFADITWSSAVAPTEGSVGQTLSAGLFNTNGTLVLAENLGGGATTFDGIDFAAGTMTFGETANIFHSTMALSDPATYSTNGEGRVSLNGLVVGQQYRIQALVFDGRGANDISGRTVEFDGIDQGQYANGVYNVTWGEGLLVTGTFTALSTVQNFTIATFDDAATSLEGGHLNAITLYRVSGSAVADLMIEGPISGGTKMVLSWTGEDGKPYGVETNSNLIVGDWQSYTTGVMGADATITITNTVGLGQTFYRVISE